MKKPMREIFQESIEAGIDSMVGHAGRCNIGKTLAEHRNLVQTYELAVRDQSIAKQDLLDARSRIMRAEEEASSEIRSKCVKK